jgi:hypothetical protein
MTATLPDVAAKRKQGEESAEQQAAAVDLGASVTVHDLVP